MNIEQVMLNDEMKKYIDIPFAGFVSSQIHQALQFCKTGIRFSVFLCPVGKNLTFE